MKDILIIEEDPIIYLDTAAYLADHGWLPLPYCPSFEVAAFFHKQENPSCILAISPFLWRENHAQQHSLIDSLAIHYLEKPFCSFQLLELLKSANPPLT